MNEQARLGLHIQSGESLSILVHGEAASLVREASETDSVGDLTIFDGEEDGAKIEASVIADLGRFDLQWGSEYAHLSIDDSLTEIFFGTPFVLPLKGSAEVARAYGYVDVEFPRDLFWTLGGAFEHYEEEGTLLPYSVTE